MDLDKAREFIRGHHQAVMATRRKDGSPQLSPVTCGVDGEGQVVVSTRETAMKVKNLQRDPAVSLCVVSDGFYGDWVQVDGRATVVSLPDAMDGLVEYYRSISGEHPDWDDYRAAMEQERRVLVRIDLERAGPDRTG
ncbi:MAG: PPOX class F420-dependent oxidoreductase [Actinobacteria bacterium]|nr:PPOX class F420-dependent oxidoreductase [Actinomycetota bacterium]